MMMTTFTRLLPILAIACSCVLIRPAHADDSWYVGGFGGVSFPDSMDDLRHVDLVRWLPFTSVVDYCRDRPPSCTGPEFSNNPLRRSAHARFDPGFVAGIVLGRTIVPNIRSELEFNYSRSYTKSARAGFRAIEGFTEIIVDPPGSSSLGNGVVYKGFGGVSSYSLLINGWFDIPIDAAIKPYIGGGVGLAIADVNMTWASTPTPTTSIVNNGYDFTDIGFAFQIGAGLRMPVTDHTTFDVSYRFRNITSIEFDPIQPSVFQFSSPDLSLHTVQIGFTMNLGH